MPSPAEIERARALLRASERVVVFTGAGVSADSGVPTFRGSSGDSFWGAYDPMRLASQKGFLKDPKLVYDWYTWRRSQLAGVAPNAAHRAIACLQREKGAVVVTQNVDGLHERVAPPGAAVERLHGTLAEDRCLNPGCDHVEALDFGNLPGLRDCPECACRMRPAVVWFGELLDQDVWGRCLRACEAADLMLVVGTSGQVYPAASLVAIAAQGGAKVVVANLDPSPLDALADVTLHARGADVVPRIVG